MLLVVGGMNTAISLFYYLRVVKVMTMEEEPATRPPFVYPEVSLQGAFVWLVTAPNDLADVELECVERVGSRCNPLSSGCCVGHEIYE